MNTILASLAIILSLAACKPESKPEFKPDSPVPPPPAAGSTDPAKPESYVGMDEKAAGAMADKAGVKWRVISVDGESRPVTMDHRPDRLNFTIEAGKVIRVTQG
ncbi:hypothetical protein OKA05_05250 [Luteolibacter arcticus]|uniref:Peptidase inhibitor I78 family protein n=1 Tax=Luteolibacter arcticus TaxID=1581411 RepID=A0ABT3GF93_9BACT|nr:hypothetical protein [Luteolibacter arcticus]MCW1921948.1 hypothetical protein [Luteolibacter arcticus]